MSEILSSSQYASTHNGAQQVSQTSVHLTSFRHGLTSEVVLWYSITGAGSLLPPVYREAWAEGKATGIPRTPFSALRDAAHRKHVGWQANNKLKNINDVLKKRREKEERSTVKSLNDVQSQVKSAYQSNSAITDIDVTFDGTWLTRGLSSQIGVGCVIDLLTGFVMDFEIICRNAALNVNTQNLAALARGEVPGPHVKHVKTPLKETHLAKIMPIYQRLASNELLQRCIRCVTQNANESLHSIIWENLQKENGLASNKQSKILAVWRDYRRVYQRKRKRLAVYAIARKKIALPKKRRNA
ncbi:uncharacterized protein TNCV_3422371 [Trichonephila clavipes]|nr:uncharacterized protein TNCV_3422371 [Trichonephila clavipes]